MGAAYGARAGAWQRALTCSACLASPGPPCQSASQREGTMTAMIMQRKLAALALIVTLGIVLVLMAAGAAIAGRFEGVASCAGSTCHGRAEGNGAVVRQDELRLWQEPSSRSGAHSRSYASLISPRGERLQPRWGWVQPVQPPLALAVMSPRRGRAANAFKSRTGSAARAATGPHRAGSPAITRSGRAMLAMLRAE